MAPPVITTVNPAHGPEPGGTDVVIIGTALTPTTAVRFGGTPATGVVPVSSTRVTAVSPPGTGTVQVTVTTPGGTSNGLPYTYDAGPPTVTALTPDFGPTSGGTTVLINGTGLSSASAVRFGGVAAASFTVLSGTQISAVTPPGGPGPVPVTVTTPGGTSQPVYFGYCAGVATPAILTLAPDTGPAAGGQTVTIFGLDLTSAGAVRFGGVAAASFTVLSDSEITAVSPPGTGTVQVTVTTPGGTSNGLPYTYVAAPALTTLDPQLGPTSGGADVTIGGSGLTFTDAVRFGATPAPAFTVLSDSQVTVVTPPGTGTVQVTVTTPGGTSNGLPYTYLPPPTG